MGFRYIRQFYGVPARRGARVKYKGHPAEITGAWRQYIRVRLDGEKKSRICHPTWEMEYTVNDTTKKPRRDVRAYRIDVELLPKELEKRIQMRRWLRQKVKDGTINALIEALWECETGQ